MGVRNEAASYILHGGTVARCKSKRLWALGEVEENLFEEEIIELGLTSN